MPPQTNIHLWFVQGSHTWLLAKVNANKKWEFATTVTIPRSAVLGEATIRVGATYPTAPFRVTGLAGTGQRAPMPAAVIASLLLIAGYALRRGRRAHDATRS